MGGMTLTAWSELRARHPAKHRHGVMSEAELGGSLMSMGELGGRV